MARRPAAPDLRGRPGQGALAAGPSDARSSAAPAAPSKEGRPASGSASKKTANRAAAKVGRSIDQFGGPAERACLKWTKLGQQESSSPVGGGGGGGEKMPAARPAPISVAANQLGWPPGPLCCRTKRDEPVLLAAPGSHLNVISPRRLLMPDGFISAQKSGAPAIGGGGGRCGADRARCRFCFIRQPSGLTSN